jgi:hypothetical protein
VDEFFESSWSTCPLRVNATRSFETSVVSLPTTHRHIPEYANVSYSDLKTSTLARSNACCSGATNLNVHNFKHACHRDEYYSYDFLGRDAVYLGRLCYCSRRQCCLLQGRIVCSTLKMETGYCSEAFVSIYQSHSVTLRKIALLV